MAHRTLAAVLILIAVIFIAVTVKAQQSSKPFTQDQVQALVRDGLADETGAKALEQRGVDFAPTEEFIQSLKSAGASDAFVAALRAVAPGLSPAHCSGGVPTAGRRSETAATKAASSEAASPDAQKAINQIQVFALLAGQVPSHRVGMLVQERGIDFDPTEDFIQNLKTAGANDALVTALPRLSG